MKAQHIFVVKDCKEELPKITNESSYAPYSDSLFTIGIFNDVANYYVPIDKRVNPYWKNGNGDKIDVTHWLKDEGEKYVFSKEELIELLKKAIRYGHDKSTAGEYLSRTLTNCDEFLQSLGLKL